MDTDGVATVQYRISIDETGAVEDDPSTWRLSEGMFRAEEDVWNLLPGTFDRLVITAEVTNPVIPGEADPWEVRYSELLTRLGSRPEALESRDSLATTGKASEDRPGRCGAQSDTICNEPSELLGARNVRLQAKLLCPEVLRSDARLAFTGAQLVTIGGRSVENVWYQRTEGKVIFARQDMAGRDSEVGLACDGETFEGTREEFLNGSEPINVAATSEPTVTKNPTEPPPSPETADSLDDVEWESVVQAPDCSGMDLGIEITGKNHADLTGDGVEDALVRVACRSTTGWPIDRVHLFDGASDPSAPRLLDVIRSSDLTRSNIATVEVAPDGLITVRTSEWTDDAPTCCPDITATGTYRWEDDGIAEVSFRAGPMTSAVDGLQATARATCTADPSTDSAGNRVTFEASNVLDADPDTAWRCEGDATGEELTLTFDEPVTISSLSLIPGYAKVDPTDGTNRFWENRTMTQVRWSFDDGTSIQQFIDDPTPDHATVTPPATGHDRHGCPRGPGDGEPRRPAPLHRNQ